MLRTVLSREMLQVRVIRDGVVIADDTIASLQRFKDAVKEVNEGYECGIA